MTRITLETSNFSYPIIDSERTGKNIKRECLKQGLSVKQLQELLGIGAFQSIYDWFSGKTLPSLDNMLALGRLLRIPVEQLIICKNDTQIAAEPEVLSRRLQKYWKRISVKVA